MCFVSGEESWSAQIRSAAVTTSIFLSLLSVVLEDLWRGKLGFGFGMRVMRELCKKMRSETVLIGKERKLGDRGGGGGGGGGDVSAAKRRRIGTPSEPKVSATFCHHCCCWCYCRRVSSRSQFCLGDYWCLHWCAWTNACETAAKHAELSILWRRRHFDRNTCN